MLNRIFDKMITGLAVLAGLLLLFITFSISYSIFARLIGIQGPIWTVQFNEYALLWFTFLGTAWVLHRRKHVSMDIITGRLKPPARGILDRVHSVMGIGVCGVLLWYGSAMTWSFFQRGVTDVQAIDIPKYLILIVIPLGALTLGIQFVRNLIVPFEGNGGHKGAGGSEAAAVESKGSGSE